MLGLQLLLLQVLVQQQLLLLLRALRRLSAAEGARPPHGVVALGPSAAAAAVLLRHVALHCGAAEPRRGAGERRLADDGRVPGKGRRRAGPQRAASTTQQAGRPASDPNPAGASRAKPTHLRTQLNSNRPLRSTQRRSAGVRCCLLEGGRPGRPVEVSQPAPLASRARTHIHKDTAAVRPAQPEPASIAAALMAEANQPACLTAESSGNLITNNFSPN